MQYVRVQSTVTAHMKVRTRTVSTCTGRRRKFQIMNFQKSDDFLRLHKHVLKSLGRAVSERSGNIGLETTNPGWFAEHAKTEGAGSSVGSV